MRDVVPLLILVLLAVGDAHVALTFPEARYPALDFLDTSRTMGPCGVPKPRKAHYTNLLAGSTYNITWRMQYPHQGGYRIILADQDGNTVEQLSPVSGMEYAGTDNQVAQSQEVHITRPCSQCTIILERQALEWGKSYRLRTCADVNVLETISANCHHDGDCLNGGKCLPEPNSIVVASCYCSYGFFGNSCELFFKREPDNCFAYEMVDEQRFNMYGMFSSSCYNREKLADDDFVYYRKVKSDVEIILDYATTSWISIGWRPEVLDRSCRLFPDLEVYCKCMNLKRKTLRTAEQTEFTHKSFSNMFHVSNLAITVNITVQSLFAAESALHAPLHAMDCIDILIGAVRDGRTRVQDSYSRDRSTPLEDFWYEGEMSLVGAYGRELDGRTIVMFRRPMQEIEPTDHPLGPGRLFVVSAKGQQQGAYSHGAPSALEVAHTIELFYMDDILKYHGIKNRGVHSINFTAPIKPWKPADTALGINTVTTEADLPTTHRTTELVNSP
ncbi:hypothetical protein Angca_000168, partial [Angiostrongylus cantonensis]